MIVLFHKKFEKKYRKLDKKLQKKIDERILLFVQNPQAPILKNHSLKGHYRDSRSINITGDYRALFIQITQDTVEFFDIDTHDHLYS